MMPNTSSILMMSLMGGKIILNWTPPICRQQSRRSKLLLRLAGKFVSCFQFCGQLFPGEMGLDVGDGVLRHRFSFLGMMQQMDKVLRNALVVARRP